jgi:hypothetical protein
MRLLKTPKKPKWRPLIEVKSAQSVPASWRHFVQFPTAKQPPADSNSALPEFAC